MFGLRRVASLTTLRSVRAFRAAPVARMASENKDLPIPGFRDENSVATNWELATGNERYEYLKRLKGEEPWEDMKPIYLYNGLGTKTNPIIIKGSDPEKYVGCSGFPEDSHEIIWLTLREHKGVDRCPHCGNAFKYQKDSHGHDHSHDAHHH